MNPPERPSRLLATMHLAALWALAVAQPLLSLLGANPEFFVARDNTGFQIAAFAVLIVAAPPLILGAVESLIGLVSQKARWAIHLGLIGLLFATLVLQFLKQFLDGPAAPMIGFSLLAGAGLAWAYGYRQFLRSLTDILTPAPLVILVAFLFFSQSAELVTSGGSVQPIKASVGNPAPVVMIVFDEFPSGSIMTPDGEVNARRFPAFGALASQSDWYRNTTTGGSYTTIAVPSIMSGLIAARDSLPTASDHPKSIFTLLGSTYLVNAIESITELCPASVCTGAADSEEGFLSAIKSLVIDSRVVEEHLLLPEDLGRNFPDISQSFAGFGDPGITVVGESEERTRARQFIAKQHIETGGAIGGGDETAQVVAGLGPSTRPKLDFGHIEEPHYPWNHYPNGTFYGRGTEDFRAFLADEVTWEGNRYVTDRATQAHLLEVGYVDSLLGQIINRLKRDGLWDESLVVVTADHGAALLPGEPRREAAPKTLGEMAMVPLFVKKPGQKQGETIKRPTCSPEILPIMAGVLDVDLPWEPSVCNRDEVIVDNGTGDLVRAPTATVISQRQAYIDRVARLFGAETGWPAVLRQGPNRNLIGESTGSLEIVPGTAGELSPDTGGVALRDFEPGRQVNYVLRQRGTVSGLEAGQALAVSVNGQISAVGRIFDATGQLTYSMLLPEDSLRRGRNDIEIFAVDRDKERTTLSRLAWPSGG